MHEIVFGLNLKKKHKRKYREFIKILFGLKSLVYGKKSMYVYKVFKGKLKEKEKKNFKTLKDLNVHFLSYLNK